MTQTITNDERAVGAASDHPASAAGTRQAPTPPRRSPAPVSEHRTRSRDREGRRQGGIPVAYVIGVTLAIAMATMAFLRLGASEGATEVASVDRLAAEVEAIDGLTARELPGKAFLQRVYVAPGDVVRYQIIYSDLLKADIVLREVFDERRDEVLDIVRGDTVSHKLFSMASSVYLDIYDPYDDYLFTYTYTPEQLLGAGEAPRG